jgi:hypothetical protein
MTRREIQSGFGLRVGFNQDLQAKHKWRPNYNKRSATVGLSESTTACVCGAPEKTDFSMNIQHHIVRLLLVAPRTRCSFSDST